MKITPASALAAWAVATTWLIVFVVLEHFDKPGPDFLDYVQWGLLLVLALLYPLFRKWFVVWLDSAKDKN